MIDRRGIVPAVFYRDPLPIFDHHYAASTKHRTNGIAAVCQMHICRYSDCSQSRSSLGAGSPQGQFRGETGKKFITDLRIGNIHIAADPLGNVPA